MNKMTMAVALLFSGIQAQAYTLELSPNGIDNMRWDARTVSFYLDLGQYNERAAHELSVWDAYTGNTRLRTTNDSSTNGGIWFNDGRSSIIWADLSSNVLGECSVNDLTSEGNSGTLHEVDIRINTDYAGAFATDYYDIGRVLLHEIGHGIGLGHSQYFGAVMFPSISSGQTDQLTADDIAGARFLYGPRTESLPDSGSTAAFLAVALAGVVWLRKVK